ncbi:MAG: oxygen-independent coproporphyrinogen III oxidase [Opitutaceae bacterium]|jgi:oxygen-independent coproporphyrinogen-3 oxidase|nr:oxygen-independent coproporphyrinogen III oxidase [Opitutaceae bacterium]
MPPDARIATGLIRRHAVPGPRYTSYPAATCFTDAYTPADALDDLRADRAENPGAPVSLYVHLPFCRSLCWYCGCNTIVSRDPADADRYLDDIGREIALVAGEAGARKFGQLHLGGGTPTFLDAGRLRRLAGLVRARFDAEAGAEISVEVDPRHLVAEQAGALAEAGFNRASLGVQDTAPAVQKAIHREQPHALNLAAAALLRAAGIRALNVDLIYGLPGQTPAGFARTLEDALELSPSRLSLFGYAHVPWLRPAQKLLERAGLPPPEARLELFALAHERLLAAGYVDIGLDHFARPDDELALARANGTLHRNFQGYSTRAGASLIGLGVTAISSTRTSHRQNFRDWARHRAALDAGRLPVERGLRLTAEDLRRREIIMRVMCDRRLDFAALSAAIGGDFERDYARELAGLADLEADGIVKTGGGTLEVTERGLPLLRVVAMRFDARHKPGPNRHAMTV